jgi:hypothetical protein
MELVAYCGGFCGQCGIFSLNMQTSLDAVRNVVQVAAFRTANAQGISVREWIDAALRAQDMH